MIIFVVILSLFIFSQAGAATKYVRKTGADGVRTCTNTGADACLTINYAIGKMIGGDTLDIGAGTYAEDIVTFSGSNIPSGNAGAYTIIQGAGINQTIITGNTYPYTRIWIGEDAHHIKLDGFTCDSTGKDGNCVLVGVGLTSNYARVPHDITISNIEGKNVRNTGAVFQSLSGAYNVLWSNLTAHMENTACNLGAGHCHGFYISGPANTIEYSNIYNNEASGIQIWGYTAAEILAQDPAATNVPNTMASNAVIRFNRIHDNGLSNNNGGGITFGKSNDSFAYDNLIWNNPAGLVFGCCVSDRTTAYNNTIYNNNIGAGFKTCFAVWSSQSNVVRNNICYQNSGGDFLQVDSGNPGTYTESNNLFNATNPIFLSTTPTSPDFLKITSGSPAIGAGTTLAAPYNVDFTGSVRPPPPDIGAYEFGLVLGSAIVTWINDRGGSGTASGTANWKTDVPSSGIPFKAGINPITVTATDNTGQTAIDTITITYAPTFPGATLALAYGFEETSGNAVDSSTNKNNGTLFNGPTRLTGTGKFGNGISLNGVNQYITANSAPSLDFTQSFTFSAYVKPHVGYSDFRPLMVKEITGGKGYVQFLYATVGGYCASGRVLGGFTANGSLGPQFAACDTTTAIPSNAWTHLALTYNNGTQELKLYKNGVLVTTSLYNNGVASPTPLPSGYMEPSTGQFRVGAVPAFNEFLDADVDEVRAYNIDIPATDGKLNTVFGAACGYRTDTVANAAADRLNMALVSVMGDANCAVIQPVAPVGPVLKIPQAPSGVKVSSGSTMKLGQ